MKVTIIDVARRANVSQSTVSNYINGRYQKMSLSTQQAIADAIADLGYTPNLSAQRLANKEKSRTICLIIPGKLTHIFDSMYYPTVFRAVEKIAKEKNYKILIYPRDKMKVEEDMQFLRSMASSMVDGYIVFDLSETNLFFKEFEKAHIPYMCVGKIPGYSKYNFVASDHSRALIDSLTYLTQLGHRHIGIILPHDVGVVYRARTNAIAEFCENTGFPEKNIVWYDISGEASEEQLLVQMTEVLSAGNRPTAYILTQSIRPMFLLAASRQGMEVPQDISYVNIEYYPKGILNAGNQTRIEARAQEIARLAFEELLKQIYGENQKKHTNILIPLSLTVGNTTSAVKAEVTD